VSIFLLPCSGDACVAIDAQRRCFHAVDICRAKTRRCASTRRRRRHYSGGSGFTLIELLLALALAAMLAAALHGAMSTAWRAKTSAEAAVEPTRAGAIAMDIIAHDLAAAPPPPSSDSTATHLGGPFTGTHQGAGNGDNDDLEFRTLAREEGKDDDPLGDGMKIVEYVISPDANSPTLIRRVTRNILSTQDLRSVDEPICRNVRGLTFKYYDGTDWQTDWDSTAVGDVLPTRR